MRISAKSTSESNCKSPPVPGKACEWLAVVPNQSFGEHCHDGLEHVGQEWRRTSRRKGEPEPLVGAGFSGPHDGSPIKRITTRKQIDTKAMFSSELSIGAS